MPSIIFFGLDGRYSTVLLEALIEAELTPSLVVVGRPDRPAFWRSEVNLVRAKPRWWSKRSPREARSEAPPSINLIEASLARGIDALELHDPGAARVRAKIREHAPDCLVVAGFHRLLPPSVLALAKKAGLNVHPGRLPEERGPAPIFWMLKEGRTEGRVTIHMLEAGEDSGDIVADAAFVFSPGSTGPEALAAAATVAAPFLVQSVGALLEGTLRGQPQVAARARRCPRPSARECRVDPRRGAREVFTYVAGCAGAYPVYVECGGDRFFVAEAHSFDQDAEMAFEYMLSGDRLLLRCSPGVVELSLKPGGALFTAEYEEESDPTIADLHG